MPTLVLTSRYNDDSQSLWRAASALGWRVERLKGFRLSADQLPITHPVLYLEGLIAPEVSQQLGIELISQPPDWLVHLPLEYRRRHIQLTTLGEARRFSTPMFVKPPNEKLFAAQVYAPGTLPNDYADAEPVLASEPVNFVSEFRCFLLHRELKTYSIYLRDGQFQRDQEFTATKSEIDALMQFVNGILGDPRIDLPRAVVLDVGQLTDSSWAVIELNAAWGSGIYGCDPVSVLEVLQAATIS